MVTIPVQADVPSVVGPPQGQWTIEDWENLPQPEDGSRYEVIDGVLYMTTSPSYFHQYIIKRLYRLIGSPAEDQDLAYADFAPIGLYLPGENPVQPDFVVVLKSNAAIIHDRRIRGVPDLIAEVLSPGSRDYDEDVKLKAYARAGVAEYVIIDPAQRQLRLYRLLQPGQYMELELFNQADSVTFACLPTIPLVVGKLFEGSPDTTL